jgi:transcriptional regulator with XRE-family HTH domain
MNPPRNIVGPQIRKLRKLRGLTQPMLVAKCNLLGWGVSRETLAKIEAQIRWVADAELMCLARSLNVPLETLVPDKPQLTKAIKGFFTGLGKG